MSLAYPPYDPTDNELMLMFDWDRKRNQVRPNSLRFCIQAESRYFPVTFKNQVYLFNHDTRLYYENTNSIRQWTLKQIRRMQTILAVPVYPPDATENEKEKDPEMYSLPPAPYLERVLRDVQVQMAACNVIEGDKFPFNQYNGFAVNNGVVVFDADLGEIYCTECTHIMMFTRKIPINWNTKADTGKVLKVLEQWLPDDNYEWLLQIPAQAVFQSLPGIAPFKQSYLLLGSPNSGKTSYSNLLTKLVGEENFATHMLHELGDPFIVASLPYKFFCFGDDLPFIKIDAGNRLKTLTGKRNTMVNPKYTRPYDADITAVFAFSANYAPQMVQQLQDDSGWWDRWAILRFTGTFEKDPTWEQRTFTNDFLEGFLQLICNEVLEILKRNGRLAHRQNPDEVKKIWVGDGQLFFDEFFVKYLEITHDDQHWITKDEMMDAVNTFVGGHYFTPREDLSETQFEEQMPKTKNALTDALAKIGVVSMPIKNEGCVIRPYYNIKWNRNALASKWCHPGSRSL